jgi:ribosomal protein L7Ae-like RNA K-turn-binding protein
MSLDSIGSAMLIIYDELKNDKKSKALVKKIDTAKNDETLKEGINEAIKRLRELDKHYLANDIEEKTKSLFK